MKIQILFDIKDSIDGFNPVFITQEGISSDMPENSATHIIMNGTLEYVSYDKIDSLLSDIRKLIRKNGKLVINGIDACCISRDFINGLIDIKTYNQAIFSRFSLHDSKEISNKLISLGFVVEKLLLRGSIYELHASRS